MECNQARWTTMQMSLKFCKILCGVVNKLAGPPYKCLLNYTNICMECKQAFFDTNVF